MRRTLLIGLLAGAFAALFAVDSTAGKPGGGSVPGGRIYFGSGGSYQSMLADGGDKRPERSGEPSRLLHGGRWFLDLAAVPGAFPTGAGRTEVFATREDGVTVQLTNDSGVQIRAYRWSILRWAKDDSFVSFSALTWAPVASGGDYVDTGGQHWLVKGALFRAALTWSGDMPAAATPASVVESGVYFPVSDGGGIYINALPDILDHDWSPAADSVAYRIRTQDQPGTVKADTLYVMTVGGGTITVGPGREAGWAPDGSRIAFEANGDIATVLPDGSGLVNVTSPPNVTDEAPHWSPDSAHLAFTRLSRRMEGGYTIWVGDVMRVSAAGGSATNLTKDLADTASARAWR